MSADDQIQVEIPARWLERATARQAPFDVPELEPPGLSDSGPDVRFADLQVEISVLLDEDWVFAHQLDFQAGKIRRHLGQLFPRGAHEASVPCRAGLTYRSYLEFRALRVPVAEAATRGGFLEGNFPVLALGEGLVSSDHFLRAFPPIDLEQHVDGSVAT